MSDGSMSYLLDQLQRRARGHRVDALARRRYPEAPTDDCEHLVRLLPVHSHQARRSTRARGTWIARPPTPIAVLSFISCGSPSLVRRDDRPPPARLSIRHATL